MFALEVVVGGLRDATQTGDEVGDDLGTGGWGNALSFRPDASVTLLAGPATRGRARGGRVEPGTSRDGGSICSSLRGAVRVVHGCCRSGQCYSGEAGWS